MTIRFWRFGLAEVLHVVPPNGRRYEDPGVIRTLEPFLLKRYPSHEIEVAWVVQPSIAPFDVVARDGGYDRITATKDAIRLELGGFVPDTPELKPD